jgi:hypothetical protein
MNSKNRKPNPSGVFFAKRKLFHPTYTRKMNVLTTPIYRSLWSRRGNHGNIRTERGSLDCCQLDSMEIRPGSVRLIKVDYHRRRIAAQNTVIVDF